MPSQFTLDDAALLLMQIEPADRDEAARLRDQLHGYADLAPPSQVVAALKASACLDAVAQGSPDAAAKLVEAGRFLEMAMGTAAGAAPAPAAPSALPAPAAVGVAGVAPVDASAGEALADDADVSLIGDFITESRECLAGAEAALLALETDPGDGEAINIVFRAFHTIKGTSAFLGLDRVAGFAHHAESLLSRVRDREIEYTSDCASLALRSSDMLTALLGEVEGALGGALMFLPDGYGELLAELEAVDATGVVPPSEGDAFGAGFAAAAAAVTFAPAAVASIAAPASAGAPPRLHDADETAFEHHPESAARSVAPHVELHVDREPAAVAAPTSAAAAKREARAESGAAPAAAESSVRVRTDRLDRLIDMVGELVIAQSMIAGDAVVVSGGHHELARKVAHTGKIVRELQDLSMSMRMVPLKATFQKLARLVRDVAPKAGKQVEFVTEGEETEVDRQMVDVIGDPLVHMVRNSVDHGIEPADERARLGKPRTGTVRIHAYHAGGQVVVELHDDGRGLNREKIVAKGVSKGLIPADRNLSDGEVFSLIFAPGFSTADKITDISGRGVGMDVVKRNIESLRGRVDIASESGKGSVFSVRLPLTLAITDGMLVRVGEERYVVPTHNIHMSFRPERASLSTIAGRGEVVMLRGEIMPVIRVHRLFGVQGAQEDPTNALLMIVGDGERRSALLVDELLGQYQVVAKRLGDGVGQVAGVSGGAILGDGRVGLILDVAEIVALARQGADRTAA